MDEWPHNVKHTYKDEIVKYCVKDEEWQELRLSLKGTSTEVKLKELQVWRDQWLLEDSDGCTYLPRAAQVQIDNYINALLRGGQLKRIEQGRIVTREFFDRWAFAFETKKLKEHP